MEKITRSLFEKVMVPNYSPRSIIPVQGKGSELIDQYGRHYIDFAGGIAVNGLGHCHPEMIKALKEQGEKLWHLSNVFTNEPALALASALTEATFAEKVFFCSSGTEANEAALKLARRYSYDHYGPEKYEIIAFDNGFHGRSLFTVCVGGKESYKVGFGPAPEGIKHVPYNDIDAFEKAISSKTCAVMMELIQAEGGVIEADLSFIKRVRELCDQYNVLLIFDEVQTGVGRTGKLYSYMHSGITPDILTSAKALGGGFPIGAMLCSSKVANSFCFGTHGSTYGGNPLACHVAYTVFSIVNQAALLENIQEKHEIFVAELNEINKKHQILEAIRGKGLLIGAELKAPWKGKAKDICQIAGEHGVIIIVAGGGDVLRFTPSYLITEQEIKEGMERLNQSLTLFLNKE